MTDPRSIRIQFQGWPDLWYADIFLGHLPLLKSTILLSLLTNLL